MLVRVMILASLWKVQTWLALRSVSLIQQHAQILSAELVRSRKQTLPLPPFILDAILNTLSFFHEHLNLRLPRMAIGIACAVTSTRHFQNTRRTKKLCLPKLPRRYANVQGRELFENMQPQHVIANQPAAFRHPLYASTMLTKQPS